MLYEWVLEMPANCINKEDGGPEVAWCSEGSNICCLHCQRRESCESNMKCSHRKVTTLCPSSTHFKGIKL